MSARRGERERERPPGRENQKNWRETKEIEIEERERKKDEFNKREESRERERERDRRGEKENGLGSISWPWLFSLSLTHSCPYLLFSTYPPPGDYMYLKKKNGGNEKIKIGILSKGKKKDCVSEVSATCELLVHLSQTAADLFSIRMGLIFPQNLQQPAAVQQQHLSSSIVKTPSCVLLLLLPSTNTQPFILPLFCFFIFVRNFRLTSI